MNIIRRFAERLWSNSEMILLEKKPQEVHEYTDNEIVLVNAENVNDCLEIKPMKKYIDIFSKMIADGNLVYYGYLNGKCVFYYCVQTKGKVYFDGCEVLTLKDNEFYSHYIYCDEDSRGHAFQVRANSLVFSQFPDKTFYIQIKPNNGPSLHNTYKSGYKDKFYLKVKNRFFRRKLFITPADKINVCNPKPMQTR